MGHLHLPNPKQKEQNTLCLLWAKSSADINQILSVETNRIVVVHTDLDSDLLHQPLTHLQCVFP